jgi:hypothetical protein
MSKHLTYFHLLEALKSPGCPLCALMHENSRRYLDSLFYECVNDPGVRAKLVRSRGFCNWHAWLSTEIHCANTGIAVIYKDLLEREIAEIGEMRDNPSAGRSFFKRWNSRKPCMICEAMASFALSYLDEVVDHISEEDFQDAFRRSDGLCLGHFRMLALRHSRHRNLSRIVDLQLEKYRSLSREMGEFLRKYDYRYTDEPMGAEADSWRRTIEQFVGKRETFGNELAPEVTSRTGPFLLPLLRRLYRLCRRCLGLAG